MKMKKIFSAITAAALAGSMVAAMPASAEPVTSGSHTFVTNEWGLDATLYSFVAGNYESTDAIKVTVSNFSDLTPGSGDLAVSFADTDDGWKSLVNAAQDSVILPMASVEDMTHTIAIQVWNATEGETAQYSVEVIHNYVPVNCWVKDSEGNPSYTSDDENANLSVYDLGIYPEAGDTVMVSFDVSGAEGTAWMKLGDWSNTNSYWEEGDAVGGVNGSYVAKLSLTQKSDSTQALPTWVPAGKTITITGVYTSDKITSLQAGDEYDIFGIEKATGKLCQRHIWVVELDELADVDHAEFEYSYGGVQKTATTSTYYTSLGDNYPEVASGCVILTTYVRGIPGRLDCDTSLVYPLV